MPINALTSHSIGANTNFVDYDVSQQAALLSPTSPSSLDPAPETIAQICSPPAASLDSESLQQLNAYRIYDTVTRASLSALSQTLSNTNLLLKQLGA